MPKYKNSKTIIDGIKFDSKDESLYYLYLKDLLAKKEIKDMFFSGEVESESLIISNNRHKQALYRALENCKIAQERVELKEYLDLISIYVTAALKALGEITGTELEEDLVNKIFSEFCVGK